jgi:hypothetical protein
MEESDPKTESPAVKETKKGTRSRVREKTGREKSLLLMELAEIKEISDIIFEKIEKQISVLKSIEASVDKKIETLKRLKEGGDLPEKQQEEATPFDDIRSMLRKGLGVKEIADIMKMPVGEVELMINLEKDRKDIPGSASFQEREQQQFNEKVPGQGTGSPLFSRKILFGLSLIVAVTAVIVYVLLSQWDRVPPTSLPKSDQVITQQQLPPIQPVQAQPVEQEMPPDIDSIRKRYSLDSEHQPIENSVDREKSVPQDEKPLLSLSEMKKKDTTVTIITAAATIRKKPDVGSNPVAWVSKGAVLKVKEDFTDDSGKKWSRVVTSDGREGWIADSVVKPSS